MARELDPAVSRYMTMVRNLPLLDSETELGLARRYRDSGDEAARDALVKSQLRHVVAIALKYRRYRLPLAELIAEGNFGLVHALSKFDPERNNRLLTYAAYWIRAYILNHIIRCWSMVGGGTGALRTKLFFKLRRERVRLMNLMGEGEEVDRLLSEKLGISREKLARMLQQLEARDLWIDGSASGNSNFRLVDNLPSPERNQEESASNVETEGHLREAVRAALQGLDERERYIAETRLMAEPEDALSLTDIGEHFGVSRERARQLEARAKQKLRARIKQLGQARGLDYRELGTAA
jgi:RNA polymerase sigma-32 factor